MSKCNTIQKRSLFYYTQYHIEMIIVYPFLHLIMLCLVSFNSTLTTIWLYAFIPIEILLQVLFVYHMEYPKIFMFQGYKYKRIQASIIGKDLNRWRFYMWWVYETRIFLYTFGVRKTIIIAECRETGDIKVQCPYCKSIMEVENIDKRCPICHKEMEDDIPLPPSIFE